jgi:hypothetical protein
MRQPIIIALATVLVFAAGFLSGLFTERHRPLPRPPLHWGGEFNRPRGPMEGPGGWHREQPFNRAALIAQVRALRPQLEAFQARMNEIDAQFNRGFDAILTPDQRAHRSEFLKRRSLQESREKESAGAPLTDDQIMKLVREQPVRTILWDVVIPLRLDFLTRIYKLDDAQRESLRGLLKERRDRVLELIDSSPPPSVMMSRIAAVVQQIAPRPPGPAPKPQDSH